MMSTSTTNLVDLTVADAAAAIRRGDTNPVELTDAYLTRIDAVNPSVNAYVTVTADRARNDARRAAEELAAGHDRGPLHGIPIALKDLVDTAGIVTAGGTDVYRTRVPERDATVAARLRDAGAVLLGKTNTHELAFGVTTNNPHWGATHNPWNLSHIPGGSSGGSGAAIAARLAAATIGTDTGGSIRIPASFCGCVGFKPTFGLVPKDGVMVMSHMVDHVGPIVRNVGDAALVLQAIAGYAASDPNSVVSPAADYRAALSGGLTGLRIGVPRATMWGLLDDEVRAAAEAALDALRAGGASVVDVELPDHLAVLGMPGELGFFSVVIEESRRVNQAAWDAHPERFGPDLQAIYSAPGLTGQQYEDVLRLGDAYNVAVRQVLTQVDLLVCPTIPMAAPAIDQEMVNIAGIDLPVTAAAVMNTTPFNMAKNPAISVPCGFTAAGLPIGLQLAGAPFDEATVLRAAHAYEQATDWHTRVAPV